MSQTSGTYTVSWTFTYLMWSVFPGRDQRREKAHGTVLSIDFLRTGEGRHGWVMSRMKGTQQVDVRTGVVGHKGVVEAGGPVRCFVDHRSFRRVHARPA